MAREHKDNASDENLTKSLEARKAELEYLDNIINTIKENKDSITGLIVGMSANGCTYRVWQGDLNACYGLAHRVKLNIEASMDEFSEPQEDWSDAE